MTDEEVFDSCRREYAGKSTAYLMAQYRSSNYALRMFHFGYFGRYDADKNPTDEGLRMKYHQRICHRMLEGLLVSRGVIKPRKHRRTYDRSFRKEMRKVRREWPLPSDEAPRYRRGPVEVA